MERDRRDCRRSPRPIAACRAIKDVDFELRKGEIHALLGENGAGKSTLTKIMAGVVDATSGKLFHAGQEIAYASPHAGARTPASPWCSRRPAWSRR